jgi:hypothetical protein
MPILDFKHVNGGKSSISRVTALDRANLLLEVAACKLLIILIRDDFAAQPVGYNQSRDVPNWNIPI